MEAEEAAEAFSILLLEKGRGKRFKIARYNSDRLYKEEGKLLDSVDYKKF